MIFSQRFKNTNHPTVNFDIAPVAHTNCQKHLGMYLDKRLNFFQHIKEKSFKANKGIALIQKLKHIFPRHSLTPFLFMNSLTMKASVIKLKRCNTMLLLKLHKLLGEHHKEKSRRNMDLNHLISRDD